MADFSGKQLTCVRGERTVFSGLDFNLDSGGALLLLGPNGSGKSSLLRMMAGFLRPAEGQLRWDGEAVGEDAEAHNGRLHYVGHHDAVKPVLDVAENVRFWAGVRGLKGDRLESALIAALDAFSIRHLYDVPGRFLSAGQKRRVNLARILAAPAPLWLLDEPTTALDRASVKRLEEIIADHRRSGGSVVLSTHTEIDLPGAQVLDLAEFSTQRARDLARDEGLMV